jgi:GcrA cell cycle regulator
MKTHPAFDASEQVWVTESGVVARTLGELQRKFPNAEIVDYYPNGYVEGGRGGWLGATQLRKIWHPRHQVPTSLKAAFIDAEVAKKQPIQVLRSVPSKKPRKAAVPVVKVSWTANEDRRLEKLLAEGLSGSAIAKRMGRTRNAVIGRCHRKGMCR